MDVRKFYTKTAIPEQLKPLQELAFNVWSCWDKSASRLFHRLDPQLFRKVNHNPVELLYRLGTERLKEVANDKGFLYELDKVYDHYKHYMSFEGVYQVDGEEKPFSRDDLIAYLCMEYGLHESLPIYSGGLAVLAGDMLKAASDVGIPMVSFGLLYRYGYFNQHINADGNQVEQFCENEWFLHPVSEVMDDKGDALIIEVPLKGNMVLAKVWKIDVGRVPLYLLDTNIHQNSPEARNITNRLYVADRTARLEQELLLSRGAEIALRALGITPKVYHLNEGHTAFIIVERLLDLMKNKGYSLEDASTIIKYSTVFTTHTPVVEGNEHYPEEMVVEYLKEDIKALGLTVDSFLSLGRVKKEKIFWLPAFAINNSHYTNGVSKIHATVSKNMWKDLFPLVHPREYPIDSITNGVHLQSWLGLQMTELFNRYIGPDYQHKADVAELWEKVESIPDGEIWNAHRRRKEQVISFIQARVSKMMVQRGYCRNKIKDVESVLNPDYLTIGFARRFAQYKRAGLLFSDPDRLLKLILNEDRPVQFVFSGKAHPADGAGKGLIKQIVDFINNNPVENHVVFIEDYDMNIARHLVQGVDVWLNTPLRPMEASGTSGIKAGINGVLNLSILDGWWPEAYNGKNGWAVGSASGAEVEAVDKELIYEAEASQLYDILENEVVGTYYDRTESDIPLEWVGMMKEAISTVCSGFNMHRNVREYLYKCYIPEINMGTKLIENNGELLKELRKHKEKIDSAWNKIYIKEYFTNIAGNLSISGAEVKIDCYVYLDDVDESLFDVEVFYCYGSESNQNRSIPLKLVEKYKDKVGKYSGTIVMEGMGQQELGVRLVPSDADFRNVYPEYVKWKD